MMTWRPLQTCIDEAGPVKGVRIRTCAPFSAARRLRGGKSRVRLDPLDQRAPARPREPLLAQLLHDLVREAGVETALLGRDAGIGLKVGVGGLAHPQLRPPERRGRRKPAADMELVELGNQKRARRIRYRP